MTSRIRTALVAIVGALGLVVAPIALAAPAAAAPLTTVLFFSNDEFTDVDEEDAFWIDSLEASGATVTVFDGGDGSAAAWTAALAGQQVFAFPEHNADLFGVAITEEAAPVIADWVAAGGLILASADYDFIITSVATGIDYTSVTDYFSDHYEGWALVSDLFPGSPSSLSDTNGTSAYDLVDWTDEQLAAFTPLYTALYTPDAPDAVETTSFVSGLFTAGAGGVIYLGYDWYPDESEAALQAEWNAYVEAILAAGLPALPAPAPAPELAATGSSVDSGIYIAGAAMLLLAGAAIFATSRRKASA